MDDKNNKPFVRKVFWTVEFSQFYNSLPDKVKDKFNYVLAVIKTEQVITTKFVKHLENTALY